MTLETYTEVVVNCGCESMQLSGVILYNGSRDVHANRVAWFAYSQMIDHTNSDRQQIIRTMWWQARSMFM